MNKQECLRLVEKYFHLESFVKNLKQPDFKISSRIFFFNDIFKEVKELRILRIAAKNVGDDIVFDVYYMAGDLSGLFHSYFFIEPKSENAAQILARVSKVCTNLSDYFYYLYQQSELLKVYLISGNLANALEHDRKNDESFKLAEIKKNLLQELASYQSTELAQMLLDRRLLHKYVSNFVFFNSKCDERVKMFLINLLSNRYRQHLCLIHEKSMISNCLCLTPERVYFKNNQEIPVYGLVEYLVKEETVVFLQMNFDFKGGN